MVAADGTACSNPCEVTVTIIDDESPPAQVTDVTLTPGNQSIAVDWSAVPGAEGYKVQWKSGSETFSDAGTDGREATIASGSTTSHTITGLTNGTSYTVQVIATRSNGTSAGSPSSEVSETPGVPSLTIEDASATEGSDVVFTVTLSQASADDVSVGYSTTDGTATSDTNDVDGADYTPPAAGATLNIASGETSGLISIVTVDDSVIEGDETFELTLSNATDATIETATATGTILNDDATPTLVLNLDAIATDNIVNVAEHSTGFSISGDTGSVDGVNITVTVGTEPLTATSADADPATWSVSVPAGASYIAEPSVEVTVNATKSGHESAADEATVTLTVDLTAPTAPTYTVPTSLQVGVELTALLPGTNTDIVSYSASGLPEGLVIDSTSGAISGTPTTATATGSTVTVSVSDNAGNATDADLTFPAVDKGEQTLVGFTYSASSITFLDAAPTVIPPTGARTTLSYSAEPATVCTVNSADGALTIAGPGDCVITATATADSNYNEATTSFTLTIQSLGALALNLDTIADDDTINIAEKAAGFSISGDTGSETGVEVVVTIGETDLPTATSTDNNGTAEWFMVVPANASYIVEPSVAVKVNATKTGHVAPDETVRTLTVDLTAPDAPTYTAPASLKVDVAISAISPTGVVDIDSYSATGLPAGLAIDTSTGAISGAPTTADASVSTVTVTVSDSAGNASNVDLTFPAVDKGDQTLVGFAYSASSITYGDTAPTVTPPSGVDTTLSYSASPESVCTVDTSTGELTIEGAGECEITATAAADSNYNEVTTSFTLTIQSLGALALNLDEITDDGTINIAEKAAGFEISGNTGSEADVEIAVTIGATPLATTSTDNSGTAEWSVDVPANASYITESSVEVTVNATKTGHVAAEEKMVTLPVDLTAPIAPTYTAPTSLKVGVAISAISPTGGTDISSYSETGLPAGLTIDASSGVISGTPSAAAATPATATVTVADAAGNTATVPVVFPAVDKGDQTLSGFGYSATTITFGATSPTVISPTGFQTSLSYSASPGSVCRVDSSNGTVTIVGPGDCVITATAAASADYNEGSATVTLTIQSLGALVLNLDTITDDDAINIAEKADGFRISGDTGSEAGVDVTVTVGDADLTTTSEDNNGTADWSVDVPGNASYIAEPSVAVTVNVAKTGYMSAAEEAVTLSVDLTEPTAPTYTVPATLKVGVALSAIGPTGGADIDTYSVVGLPDGLTIESSNGAISGTPTNANASVSPVTVTVSDAAGNTATVTLTFPAVDKGDQTLVGFTYSASSITYGATVPTVTAPSGAKTTLSYSAAPATVCTVNSVDGTLSIEGPGDCLITATAAASADYNEATAAFTLAIQSLGALVLNLDTIAEDDTINIAEKATGFSISGNTGSVADVDVAVTIGGTDLTSHIDRQRRHRRVVARHTRGCELHRRTKCSSEGQRDEDRACSGG